MLPLEPARLSTTTGWPRSSESFWPKTRAAMSGAPPATVDTMSLMARDGYCASAVVAASASTQTTSARMSFAVIGYFVGSLIYLAACGERELGAQASGG